MTTFFIVIVALIVGFILFGISLMAWDERVWKPIKKRVCSEYLLCEKHGIPIMDYETGCVNRSCKICEERKMEWKRGLLKNLGLPNANIDSRKLHIGSVFYWKHEGWGDSDVMDGVREIFGWLRERKLSSKEGKSEDGCFQYFRIIKQGEFSIGFNVLLDSETFFPKRLSFHMVLVEKEGTMELVRYEESKTISSTEDFSDTFNSFCAQTKKIILDRSIPGTGWINGGDSTALWLKDLHSETNAIRLDRSISGTGWIDGDRDEDETVYLP